MSDKSWDERQHLRYQVQWEVQVTAATWTDVLTLTARSVSRGGLFIGSSQPAEVGTDVEVVLQLPDGSDLRIGGSIVRVVSMDDPAGRTPGFGLRFKEEQTSDLILLESMASAYGTPEAGTPSDRRMSARVITKQVVTEESTVELDTESEAHKKPTPRGLGMVETEDPSKRPTPGGLSAQVGEASVEERPAWAEQRTKEMKPPLEAEAEAGQPEAVETADVPAQTVEEVLLAALGTKPAERPTVDAAPVGEPSGDEGLFVVTDTADADEFPDPKDVQASTYDVGEQIQSLKGAVHDEPVAADRQVPPRGEHLKLLSLDKTPTFDAKALSRARRLAELHEELERPEPQEPAPAEPERPEEQELEWQPEAKPEEPEEPEWKPEPEEPVRADADVEDPAVPLESPLESQSRQLEDGWESVDLSDLSDEEQEGPATVPPLDQGEPERVKEEEPQRAPAGIHITSQASRAFGIDFGTSYCSICLAHGDELVVLEDDDGQTLIPTAVSYPEHGPPVVGWAARERIATHPSTTFVSPKRLIGRKYDDPSIEAFLASSPVWTSRGPHGLVMAEVYGHPLSMVQVCADIFRHIADIGRKRTGLDVKQAELAAPVGFSHEQKEGIARAAQMAGIEVVGMTAEPIAAAVAHGARSDAHELVAVYDFGGGTFDFTLLRARGDRYEVLAEAGDSWLGGDDFDLIMANYVADEFEKESKVDLRKRQVEWQRLLFLCEEAKRRLSIEEEVSVKASGIALSISGAIDLNVPVERELFNELCRDLVERTFEILATCFAMTDVGPEQVDQVVMIGGVSRIPFVKRQVEKFFQREVSYTVSPEQAVAMGTARIAYKQASEAAVQVT